MTKKKPMPIPRTARKGDVLILRCGIRRVYDHRLPQTDTIIAEESEPSMWCRDGSYVNPRKPGFDVVGFVRANHKKAKPDPDAQFLLDLFAGPGKDDAIRRRIKRIATRLSQSEK